MQIAGIDFGTTNIRIATWNQEEGVNPEVQQIGRGLDPLCMPAVIALRHEPDGSVSRLFGEAADVLENNGSTLVIRHIKQSALSSDAYLTHRLGLAEAEDRRKAIKEWQEGHFEVWGQHFQVWDLIAELLGEAVGRAGLTGEFEWRGGCPVHSGYEYRKNLAECLSRLGGECKISSIIEEPVLFLILANSRGALRREGDNSGYLVYDMGGGSFDSALAVIEEGGMVIYGADADPTIGGSDVDKFLHENFEEDVPVNTLRIAKEQLKPGSAPVDLPGGHTLTWGDVVEATERQKLPKLSLMATIDAYKWAKILWERGEDGPPVGTTASAGDAQKHVGQLTWADAAGEDALKAVILFGGPTKSPYFRSLLADKFGADKVVAASELLGRVFADADIELTGLCIGACLSAQESFAPLFVSRVPARIALRDRRTGHEVAYEPYELFGRQEKFINPIASFKSEILTEDMELHPDYEVVITSPDGDVLHRREVTGYLSEANGEDGKRLIAAKRYLELDRLGQLFVVKESANNFKDTHRVMEENPPWQTATQRQAWNAILQKQREYAERQRAAGNRELAESEKPINWT